MGYAAAPGLTALGFIMAADLMFCMLGLVVDHPFGFDLPQRRALSGLVADLAG